MSTMSIIVTETKQLKEQQKHTRVNIRSSCFYANKINNKNVSLENQHVGLRQKALQSSIITSLKTFTS